METVIIDRVPHNNLYYLDHPSVSERMTLTPDEILDLKAQLVQMFKPTKPDAPKLIIHETNCHGQGVVVYKGEPHPYTYDDGSWGDVRRTVEQLIEIGFIKEEDVMILEEYDIYDHLDIK